MGNTREHEVDGIRVKIELEAEDTLAVRLRSIHVEGPAGSEPARQVLERQARTIVNEVTYLDGALGVIEVDGISNAVQIRTKKPAETGRFVEVVLRGGNAATLDSRGGSVHVARENYDRLVETMTGLVRER